MKYLFLFLLSFGFVNLYSQADCTKHCAEVIIDKMTFTTCLSIKEKDGKIQITTPKNADIRLLGRPKSYLGRLTRKLPKKGILLKMDGIRTGDAISGTANIAFFGSFAFTGTFSDALDINILNLSGESFGRIKSFPKNQCPTVNYKELYKKMTQVTEENIFSKDILKDNTYVKIQHDLEKLFSKAKDDIELFFGFQTNTSSMPFSHYHLWMIPNIDQQNSNEEKVDVNTEYKLISDKTAYLKIDNFESTKQEISDIFDQIHTQTSLQNLIIDLRDNPGGGIEAGYEFGKHVMHDQTDIGYFITQRYNTGKFDKDIFSQLPLATATTTEDFLKQLESKGGLLMSFKNETNKIFEGQIYVLISDVTASTSEPIAYALAQKRNAILVGQTTAGAMLSAKVVDLIGKYRLFMPIGDFYTFDGVRLEGKGVSPTHACDAAQALEVALKLIEKQ